MQINQQSNFNETSNMIATFGEVNIALPVVNVEAPEETGDEIDGGCTDVVAQPGLDGPGKAVPRIAGYDRAEHDFVVPIGLLHELSQVLRRARVRHY